MIPVEEIRPGFTVNLPRGGPRVVSRVEKYDDETFVVIYFQHGEVTFENKSTAHGTRHHSRLVERGLTPFRPGERVDAEHGSAITAERLRAQLERDDAARLEQALDRTYA